MSGLSALLAAGTLVNAREYPMPPTSGPHERAEHPEGEALVALIVGTEADFVIGCGCLTKSEALALLVVSLNETCAAVIAEHARLS